MTHQIIKTENYLLVVDDSEIKVGDFYLRYNSSILRCIELKKSFNEALNKNEIIILANGCGDPYERSIDYLKKIIAHLPLNNSPILEGVPLLPPFTRHQEDGIEELAELNGHPESSGFFDYKEGFLDGFFEAKQKYKYTEEDMKRIYEKGYSSGRNELSSRKSDEVKYGFIQSLSQPKMPIGFECENEYTCCRRYYNCKGCDATAEMINLKLKTTTNSQGQIEWVGKYIY